MIEDTDGWFGVPQKVGVLCCGSIDPNTPRQTIADFFLELMPNESLLDIFLHAFRFEIHCSPGLLDIHRLPRS
jgi:hypothetical protein